MAAAVTCPVAMGAGYWRAGMAAVSKEEYLKRYMDDSETPAGKKKRKKVKTLKAGGMRIVDDDVTWKNQKEAEERECEEEDEAPLVAEFIDERPEIVRRMEEFRSSSKWKILADDNESEQPLHTGSPTPDAGEYMPGGRGGNPLLDRKTSEFSSPRRRRHDSPDLSPRNRAGERSQLSESPDPSQSRTRQNCADFSVVPKKSCLSPDSPGGLGSDSDLSPPRKGRNRSSHSKSAAAREQSDVKADERERKSAVPPRGRHDSDSDLSPPRKGPGHSSDSDLSPPRRRNAEPDLSPPRRGHIIDRRGNSRGQSPGGKGSRQVPGRKVGLLSVDILRQEKEEEKLQHSVGEHLAANESRNATTVFRDKSGKKRNLHQERIEHRQKQKETEAKAEKYAQWGKGLAQGEQQKKNTEAALHEMQKPLTRHADDEDLEQMLRERERDGDPMAGLLRRKKEAKSKNTKPRYTGRMPPPNRFDIYPGYRWDGVDRSNGFEQKRYARLADQKAVQDMAYKWSVEDM